MNFRDKLIFEKKNIELNISEEYYAIIKKNTENLFENILLLLNLSRNQNEAVVLFRFDGKKFSLLRYGINEDLFPYFCCSKHIGINVQDIRIILPYYEDAKILYNVDNTYLNNNVFKADRFFYWNYDYGPLGKINFDTLRQWFIMAGGSNNSFNYLMSETISRQINSRDFSINRFYCLYWYKKFDINYLKQLCLENDIEFYFDGDIKFRINLKNDLKLQKKLK